MITTRVIELMKSADGADATGLWVQMPAWPEGGKAMAVASIDGAGAITSNISIEGSHDGTHAVPIGAPIALTANDTDSDKQAIDYPWPFLRAVSSGLTGAVSGLRVTVAL